MRPLARIEAVLFLREVPLFSYCDAEEVLRIAAIANEERFAPGEEVFAVGEPSEALYCVVEGTVRIEGEGGRAVTAERRGAFGVFDILSGRLRTSRAVAETETVALALRADDFFDLLSNNIEIVKALFRRLAASDGDEERSLVV